MFHVDQVPSTFKRINDIKDIKLDCPKLKAQMSQFVDIAGSVSSFGAGLGNNVIASYHHNCVRRLLGQIGFQKCVKLRNRLNSDCDLLIVGSVSEIDQGKEKECKGLSIKADGEPRLSQVSS
jgi:hypothetical protein